MNHAVTLAQLGRYVFRPSFWDADAEEWSRRLPSDSPGDSVKWFRERVQSGEAKVCTIERDGEKIGFVVFRVEPNNELLIMGAFGRDPEPGRCTLVAVLERHCEQIARACECDTIRFHTMRPGLIAAAQKFGFHVSEVILRKQI